MSNFPELVAVITAALGTNVWDVVYPAGGLPILVVHVEDVGRWWSTNKPALDRVFEVGGYTATGLPVQVQTRKGVYSDTFSARFEVIEPPVSFGFGVIWLGLTADEKTRLGKLVRERTSDKARVAVGGGLYRIAGKRTIPQEFQTPYAAFWGLQQLCGPELDRVVNFPGLLRSHMAWKGRFA